MVDKAQTFATGNEIDAKIAHRNFIANVLDGAFFSFGMSFVSIQTVLPVFIKKNGGGNIEIGLIPVCWTIGFNFPQILIASYTQRFRIKKRLMLKTALGQRLPWLLLALLTFFIMPRVRAPIALMLFFILFVFAAIGGSINLPVWFDMIAKITRTEKLGRLFATRLIVGAAFGIIGGLIAKYVIDAIAFPANFALLFLLAFFMMMVSYFFLTLLKERRSQVRSKPLHLKEYAQSVPIILKHERNYRNFLIADALQYLALMASAFFTVHALAKFSLTESYAGTFTAVMMGTMIIGNAILRYLADHLGHRINLILSSGVMFLTCILALLAPTVKVYYLVFVGAAFTLSLSQISRLPLIARLGSVEQRPTFIALANMVTSPFILSGVAGGLLVDRFGFDLVFLLAGGISLAATLWLITMVKEPQE